MTDAATLLTRSGEPFTTSGSVYMDAHPRFQEDRPRIYAKFRPDVFIAPDWQGPSFFGYPGMLDRLRFAIDPDLNHFYFGPLP